MVGYSLAVYQQVGQVNAQFRTALALSESGDMLIPDGLGEVINDLFQRFDIDRDICIIIGERLYGNARYLCQCGKKC